MTRIREACELKNGLSWAYDRRPDVQNDNGGTVHILGVSLVVASFSIHLRFQFRSKTRRKQCSVCRDEMHVTSECPTWSLGSYS